jgi:four helix bundle protein
MASASLEGLRVYQVAEQLADDIWNMVALWPKLAQESVGLEIIRAADNIGASIAAGFGRGTYADNSRFARIARGSHMEVKHCLRRAHTRGIITTAQFERLHPLMRQLPISLNAYLKAIAKASKPLGKDGTSDRFRQ